MVRLNVAVVALIGTTEAININNRYIVGDFDDDQAVIDRLNVERSNAQKLATDFDNNVLGVKAMIEGTNRGQSMTQVKSKSDPIEGSAGTDPVVLSKFGTEEQKYEEYLTTLKPKNFTFEHGADDHPETQDSIAWAEKALNASLTIPAVKDPRITEGEREEIFDYDDDADVTSTLKSAHQAELIYGLHKAQNNYHHIHNTGEEGEGVHERYWKNGTRKLGLNGEEEHNSEQYTPTWGGNSTHDAYNREYGTPKPEERGRSGWSQNYTNHFYDEDAKKDWWRHLIKDKDHLSGDGMVSITLGIPDYKLDGSRPYMDVVKEAIEQQAAKDNQAKTSAEDRAFGKQIKQEVPSSEEPMNNAGKGPLPPTPPASAPASSDEVPAEVANKQASGPTTAPAPPANGDVPPEIDAGLASAQMPSSSASEAAPAIVQQSQPKDFSEEDDGRAAMPPAVPIQAHFQVPKMKTTAEELSGFMNTKSSAMGEINIDGEIIAVPDVGDQKADAEMLDQDI